MDFFDKNGPIIIMCSACMILSFTSFNISSENTRLSIENVNIRAEARAECRRNIDLLINPKSTKEV
jgi:hypothetical protein